MSFHALPLAAVLALTGCAGDQAAWQVPAGSVASADYRPAAFTAPANSMAAPVDGAAAAPAMDHSRHDHAAHMRMQKAAAEAAPSAAVPATGVVRAVDPDKRKIKIAHDPIAALNWPVMVMDFAAASGVDLKSVKAGDKVAFTLQQNGSGEYVVQSLKAGGGDMAGHAHHQHGATQQ